MKRLLTICLLVTCIGALRAEEKISNEEYGQLFDANLRAMVRVQHPEVKEVNSDHLMKICFDLAIYRIYETDYKKITDPDAQKQFLAAPMIRIMENCRDAKLLPSQVPYELRCLWANKGLQEFLARQKLTAK